MREGSIAGWSRKRNGLARMTVCLLLAGGVSCHGQTHKVPAGYASGGGGTKRVSIDDAYFSVPALSLNMPTGWKLQGTIRHDIGCSPGDAFQTYRLTSPDGQIVISEQTPFFTIYPAQMSQNLNVRGCGVISPSAPTGDMLTKYVIPALAPGAKMGAPENVPNVDQWGEQLGFLPGIPDVGQDAARVKITYTEGGQNWEAWIVGLSIYKKVNAQGWGFSVTRVGSVRAPAGHLAEAEANLGWALKLTANPDWVQRETARADQQAGQIQARGAQTRQGIAADAQAHMNATNAWTQSNIDAIHRTGNASMQAARDSENARHSAAVGTANYAGDRPTSYYHWRNTQTGATRVTNNPTNPGPGWVSTD